MNDDHLPARAGQGEGLLPYARLLAFCAVYLGLAPEQAWRSPVREILLLAHALATPDPLTRPARAHLEDLMRQFPDAKGRPAQGHEHRKER